MKPFVLVAALFVLPSVPVAPTTALRDSGSMELIAVQNRIAGFQELRRLQFVLPGPMAERLAKDQEQALSNVRGGMAEGLAEVDTALDDLRRKNEEKNSEAKKLLQKTAERVFKDTHAVDELMAKWDKVHLNRERAISAAIPAMAKDIDALAVADKKFSGNFISRLAIVYGGPSRHTVGTHDAFLQMAKEVQQHEDALRARLELLSRLKKWMETYEFLKEPQTWLQGQIDKHLVEFLAAGYEDEHKEFLTSVFTAVRESVTETVAQWQSIDQSVVNVPESTRQACKAFAVAGGMIKVILAGLKATPLRGPFQAVLEAIGYYVDAFDTIWKSAEVLGKVFDKQRQGVAGEVEWGLESKLRDEKGELYRDEDAAAFGVPILTNSRQWFLLTSSKEYETITQEQRDRIVQAIADERIINGFYEASLGWWGFAGEKIGNAFDLAGSLGKADLGESNRKAYETRLVNVSRRTLIDSKSLVAMMGDDNSQGYFSVRGTRRSTSAAQLATMREEFLEQLGRDLFIREAMVAPATRPEWRKAYSDFWLIVVQSDMTFLRTQLQNLFRAFVENPDGTRLANALRRESERRLMDDLELAVVFLGSGVADELPLGADAVIEADVVIEGLPAGAEVDAQVTWKGPAWCKTEPSTIRIRNGVRTVELKVKVPESEAGKDAVFRVRVQAGEVPAEGQVVCKTRPKPVLGLKFFENKPPAIDGWMAYIAIALNADDGFFATPDAKDFRQKESVYANARGALQKRARTSTRHWVTMTIDVAGRQYTCWERLRVGSSNLEEYPLARFAAKVPLGPPGTYKVRCSSRVAGDEYVFESEVVVPPLPDAQRQTTERELESLLATYRTVTSSPSTASSLGWAAANLGDCYKRLVQPDEARKYWEIAASAGSDQGKGGLIMYDLEWGRLDEAARLLGEHAKQYSLELAKATLLHTDDLDAANRWLAKFEEWQQRKTEEDQLPFPPTRESLLQ